MFTASFTVLHYFLVMRDSLLLNLLYVAAAIYIGYIYHCDFLSGKRGRAHPGAMPGATSAGPRLYAIGAVGALLILLIETMGELALGVSSEQSDIYWFLGLASLGAGIVEEVIFRGFLVVEKRGRSILILSCILFSLLFALLHPFLWELTYTEGVDVWKFWAAELNLIFTPKAFFTTSILFFNSLWFYALRFGSWNPNRSLFPGMLAHSLSNIGVFAIKWMQGHLEW